MIEKYDIGDDYYINHKLQFVLFNLTDGKLKICFEKTMSKLQWVYNFAFSPFLIRRAYKDMVEKFSVHWGFHKCYHAVRDELINYVKTNIESIYSISIYGASHGCSAALAFCEDLIFNNLHQGIMLECNYGGSPKWMSKKAEKIIRRRVCTKAIEWENGSDIVNKLAPFYTQYKIIKHLGQPRKWYKWSIKDHKDICTLMRDKYEQE
jgi:hypothetical protein